MHFLPPPPRFLSTGSARFPTSEGNSEHRSRNLSRVLLSLSLSLVPSVDCKNRGWKERTYVRLRYAEGWGRIVFAFFLSPRQRDIRTSIDSFQGQGAMPPSSDPATVIQRKLPLIPWNFLTRCFAISKNSPLWDGHGKCRLPSTREIERSTNGNVLEHVPSLRFRGENLSSGPSCFLSKRVLPSKLDTNIRFAEYCLAGNDDFRGSRFLHDDSQWISSDLISTCFSKVSSPGEFLWKCRFSPTNDCLR